MSVLVLVLSPAQRNERNDSAAFDVDGALAGGGGEEEAILSGLSETSATSSQRESDRARTALHRERNRRPMPTTAAKGVCKD